MGFFKKSTAASDSAEGRRRLPATERRGGPGTMFSYYSQRDASGGPNLGRREPIETVSADRGGILGNFARHKTLTICLTLVVITGLGYASLLGANPKIVLLEDEATTYFLQDSEVYRRTAAESLSKSLFNRNKLTVDTAAVRLSLLKHHPEIKNVSVSLPFFGRQPKVYIEPYKPSFILTTTYSNAYLLDATGRALANTNQIADVENLGVPTLQDKTGNQIELGKRAIPGSTVTFLQTVRTALKAKGVETATLSLPAAAYQADVAIAGQPYVVKFNLVNDALQQAGTYLAVRNRLQAEKVTPAQYIDVRVPDRAYYK